SYVGDRSYLLVPAWTLQCQVSECIPAGRLDAAIEAERQYRSYLPRDTEPTIEVVRALDRANRKAHADRLCAEVRRQYRESCKAFPRSAWAHNQAAWLAARCGRQLNQALEHARKAVELEPERRNYLSTLAEVHFQRGERPAAMRLIRRCLEL